VVIDQQPPLTLARPPELKDCRKEFVNLFPVSISEIIRTKRAIKLVFKNNSLKNGENEKWNRDELRIFMNTAKKAIASSQKRYYLKIFDLNSRRTVNIYKFSSKDYGWKTINISGRFHVLFQRY
jgi:hypothetical protein